MEKEKRPQKTERVIFHYGNDNNLEYPPQLKTPYPNIVK